MVESCKSPHVDARLTDLRITVLGS